MKVGIYLLICLAMMSCTAYQYVSSPQYIPLNDKKDELKVNVSHNNIHIGYSAFNHFSIFTTGFYRSINSSSSILTKENGGSYYYSDKMYEINFGTSYFNKFFLFNYEVLAGGGFGALEYMNQRDVNNDYKFTLKLDKFDLFIQPNAGFKIKDILELGVCSRFSYHKYYGITTSTIYGSNNIVETEDRYFDNKTSLDLLFWEPGFSLKVGLKKVKFTLLLSHTENLTYNQIKYREDNIKMGILINLDFENL